MRTSFLLPVLLALSTLSWAQSAPPSGTENAASKPVTAAKRTAERTAAATAAATHPEDWLPLVHNSTQPVPEVLPANLPPTSPQAGDGEAELIHRAALAWFDVAIAHIDQLIPPAESAADALLAGGDLYVSGSPGFIAECNGRAGGLACTKSWDGKHLGAGDVLIIGQLNPNQEGPLNAGLSNVIRGDLSVATGRVVHIASHNWTLVHDLKDHVNPQRWGNNRLALIDTHAPEATTLQNIALGQMATTAMAWAFQGEIFAAATRKGKTLVTYASIGEPYGREWFSYFQGQKLHTRFNVPPIPPGKIARDYLLTCQAELAEFFTHQQGPQYRLAADRMAKVMNAGRTVWSTTGNHVLVTGAIIPPQMPRLVILGKSYDWRIAYLHKGDLLLLPGVYNYPQTTVDEAVAAGGQAVYMSVGDGPTDDNRTHIQSFSTRTDSAVNIPDYPIRILPVTGVEQLIEWYSLLAETQKLLPPTN